MDPEGTLSFSQDLATESDGPILHPHISYL